MEIKMLSFLVVTKFKTTYVEIYKKYVYKIFRFNLVEVGNNTHKKWNNL